VPARDNSKQCRTDCAKACNADFQGISHVKSPPVWDRPQRTCEALKLYSAAHPIGMRKGRYSTLK
jgi:hypothetical protein